MKHNIVILGASYGSLLGTKLLMAGHDVTLICRQQTADLINAEGTVVRLRLRGEDDFRTIRSTDLPGTLTAATTDTADVADFDMAVLAMQEPQFSSPNVRDLMTRIADHGLPSLSLMNMPPPPFLRRIPGLDVGALSDAYSAPSLWDGFAPGLVTLCSPDPQAFRPPEEGANVLQVGLPTNFKAAPFAAPAHNRMLERLAEDIDAVRLDGKDVPVKLRVHTSLFVPLAKWSMLLTGNYRCVTATGAQAIRDAVHTDPGASMAIYEWVDELARRLGADASDQVPFAKYATAAESLLKPSSAARAIESGATAIERVDRLVQAAGVAMGMQLDAVDQTVAVVDARLRSNRAVAA